MSDKNKHPYIRPKPAATLIITRRDSDGLRILMGQRHQSHRFMPNKYVFPGGRVDAGDYRVPVAGELNQQNHRRLLSGSKKVPDNLPRALALAAIRETYEETGLAVGVKARQELSCRAKDWQDYFQLGLAPTLEPLHLIARAITPPNRPRRFDARFFMVSSEFVVNHRQQTLVGSGELLDLCWFSLDQARQLNLPAITKLVLGEVEKRADTNPQALEKIPIPFYHFERGDSKMELID